MTAFLRTYHAHCAEFGRAATHRELFAGTAMLLVNLTAWPTLAWAVMG